MEQKVILIAEDDESQAEILKDAFEDTGYEVLLAADGAMALDVYSTRRPDVILLDYDMPIKNGREVLAGIRTADTLTPVVFLTGHRIGKEDSQDCYQLGIDNYFEKPVSPIRLVEFVDNLLEKHYRYAQKLRIGNSELDIAALTFTTGGEKQNLTCKEAQLLQRLVKGFNCVVPKDELMQCLWKDPNDSNRQVFSNVIHNLKKKLKKDASVLLSSKYGEGYILEVTP